MFRVIIKTAIRNILTHRSHSIINIAVLTIGLTILFMIMIFVRHQLAGGRVIIHDIAGP